MAESEELEQVLGYRFRRPELLRRALTHRSLAAERPDLTENSDNEPLEFLGDAVLGFIVSEELFHRYPEAREGQLSQLKAQVVNAKHLHSCAVRLGLGRFLLLGHGEERSGGRERKRILANAMEALIAAMHLDGGLETAQRFVRARILDETSPVGPEEVSALNHKSQLQTYAQTLGLALPKYNIVEISGPEHAKVFTVEARIGEQAGRGTGTSKKLASQAAAEALIGELQLAEPMRSQS
jgi:ribonuclease-3